jgi:hypothetical protein
MIAAPAPWTTRAATRAATLGATAQAAEAVPNATRPIANIRRFPTRSPTAPADSSRAANGSV